MDYRALASFLVDVEQYLPTEEMRREARRLQAHAATHRDHCNQFKFQYHLPGERWEETPFSFFVDMLGGSDEEADHKKLAYALGKALADDYGDQVRFQVNDSLQGNYCYPEGFFCQVVKEEME